MALFTALAMSSLGLLLHRLSTRRYQEILLQRLLASGTRLLLILRSQQVILLCFYGIEAHPSGQAL